MSDGILPWLARRASAIASGPLPAQVRRAAQAVILHDLTCAALATGPVVGKAEAFAAADGHRSGPQATVLGTADSFGEATAALLGGVRTHALALDSTHLPSQAHLGAAILPAAFATAQRHGSTGAELLAAVVAAWETAALIGELQLDDVLRQGLRASAAFGAIGAAAVTALLSGLDSDGVANAIALSTNLGSGRSRTLVDGSDEWAMQLGLAAEAGIRSVRLVRAGITGALGVFGIGKVDQPEAWRMLDTTYKWYSACNILQAPIELAAQLHGSLRMSDARITVSLNPDDLAYPGIRNAHPTAPVAAMMSAKFCVATALLYGHLPDALLGDPRSDPAVTALGERITVAPDQTLPELGARLELETPAGPVVRTLIPDRDTFGFTWDQVVSVTGQRRQRAGQPPDRQARLVAAVAALPQLEDVGPVLACA